MPSRPRARVLALSLSLSLAAAVELPAVLRQDGATVYPQCSMSEKTRIGGILSRCQACLADACPESCCVEKPSSNQYVVCDVPAEGGKPGCCVRVMGDSAVEVAASETVKAAGKGAGGICAPADPGVESDCPAATCAIAGLNQAQSPCPAGVLVPQPSAVYAGPAKCADGSSGGEAAAPGAATTAAATEAVDPAAAAAVAGGLAAAGVAAPGVGAAPVAGAVPAGCTKTMPGKRCQGAVGQAAVKYIGGCCVGECKPDPAKGWGSWCPELISGADAGAGGLAAPGSVPPVATAVVPVVTTVAPVPVVTTNASDSTLIPVVVPEEPKVNNKTGNGTKVGTEGEKKCFHPSGIVELEAGLTKAVADVAIGDRVKVGQFDYSEVFLLTHQDPSTESAFVNATTQSGHHVVVTPGHYLFVNGGLMDSKDVSVGDMLALGDGGASAVVSVSSIHGAGLYNPQTLDGAIVVNGVKASTYTTAISPSVAHTLLWPLRVVYSVFGLSASGFERSNTISTSIAELLPSGPSYLSTA